MCEFYYYFFIVRNISSKTTVEAVHFRGTKACRPNVRSRMMCLHLEVPRTLFVEIFPVISNSFCHCIPHCINLKTFSLPNWQGQMPFFTTDTMYKECLKCTLWDGEKSKNFCCLLPCSRQPINIKHSSAV